jgi:hypothetical protein
MSFSDDSANNFLVESIRKFSRELIDRGPAIGKGLRKTVNGFACISLHLL